LFLAGFILDLLFDNEGGSSFYETARRHIPFYKGKIEPGKGKGKFIPVTGRGGP
jgi:hypothetical protein